MKHHDVLNGDADPFTQLETLCAHRWDSHLLMQLAAAAGPRRRADIAAEITRAASERISDGQLDRTIRRLTSRRLLQPVSDGQGHKLYQLTSIGVQHASRLKLLLQLISPPPAHGQA